MGTPVDGTSGKDGRQSMSVDLDENRRRKQKSVGVQAVQGQKARELSAESVVSCRQVQHRLGLDMSEGP